MPYFGVRHPSRGRISGPWGRWIPEKDGLRLRRLALDVAAGLVAQETMQELALAVEDALAETGLEEERLWWTCHRSLSRE